MISLLKKIERALQNTLEGSSSLTVKDVQPLDLVRQIQREIESNKRVFINNQIYVAHKLVIHLHAPSPSKVEEYEALFNNTEFREFLEQYIKEKGYQLLDRIRISIQCHQDRLPEFNKRHCFVEFSWPQVGGDPGEITVLLDPENHDRILSVNAPKEEIKPEAWLQVIEGTAYMRNCRISRREFNLGRCENVINNKTGKLLRTNHLAFSPPAAGDIVNRSISRQHARICERGGAFFLYDNGSQNGTSLERGNSVLLVPRSNLGADGIELAEGDVIVLGRARICFHIGPMPAS